MVRIKLGDLNMSIIGQKGVWILILVLIVLASYISVQVEAAEENQIRVVTTAGAISNLRSTLSAAQAKAATGDFEPGQTTLGLVDLESLQNSVGSFTIVEQAWVPAFLEDRAFTLTTQQAQLLDTVLTEHAYGTDWPDKVGFQQQDQQGEWQTITRTQLTQLSAIEVSALPAGLLTGSASGGTNVYCTLEAAQT